MNETPAPRPPLGMALRVAHVRAAQLFGQHLQALGLENQQAGILASLGTMGLQTQRQLVDGMGMDKSTMVRALDTLEARGLLRREPHPTDRRAHAVVLTEEGRAMAAQVRSAIDLTEDELTRGLSPEERELLHSLLIRFAQG